MNKKIVFAGDLHLKPQLYASFRDVTGDTYFALRQIVDYCLRGDVASLVIAGDFFDRPVVDSEEFHVAQREFLRLKSAGVPVYWIDGNHDRADPSWGCL